MNFCENCNFLVEGEVCPKCGNENIREVKAEDFCFFMDIDDFYCTMLEEALKANGIEAVCVPYYTGGVTYGSAGRAGGRHVFVRHKDFESAGEIYDELFSSED